MLMSHRRRLFAAHLAAVLVLGALAAARADEGKPTVIRIGIPGVGNGNRPIIGGSSIANVHLLGLLEKEFQQDGIKIEWSFLRGAGPAVNEGFANGLFDVAGGLGDLPSIIGRAGGLKFKIVAGAGSRQNTYLVVPADSTITSVKELKGKRVAIFKGTNIQLAIAKILEANGLTEKDLKVVNMDNATAKAALSTKDIDAAWGNYDYLALRDQGVAKVIYDTKGAEPRLLKSSSLLVSEGFINKYPSITRRIVKALVVGAKYMSDLDSDKERTKAFQLWSKTGFPYSNFKEDFEGKGQLRLRSSPLIDDYFVSQYGRAIADSKRFGLIRNDIDLKAWIDDSFLKAALKELDLEGYWTPADAQGNVKGSS
jgi:sulfonate transport system substrate-binding protein